MKLVEVVDRGLKESTIARCYCCWWFKHVAARPRRNCGPVAHFSASLFVSLISRLFFAFFGFENFILVLNLSCITQGATKTSEYDFSLVPSYSATEHSATQNPTPRSFLSATTVIVIMDFRTDIQRLHTLRFLCNRAGIDVTMKNTQKVLNLSTNTASFPRDDLVILEENLVFKENQDPSIKFQKMRGGAL